MKIMAESILGNKKNPLVSMHQGIYSFLDQEYSQLLTGKARPPG